MGKEKPATKKKCFVRMDMIIQQLEEASGYHKGEFESKRHQIVGRISYALREAISLKKDLRQLLRRAIVSKKIKNN